jgi:mannose-6-phosphate isomerase-like protein (cupin superfamily)
MAVACGVASLLGAAVAIGSRVQAQGKEVSESKVPGYVLKPGEGEALGPARLIKASPRSGTQGGVVVLDQLPAGFTTDFHIHKTSDEFFYVISGTGTAAIGHKETPLGPGDFIFVAAAGVHKMSVSGDGPMELLFIFDKPGADNFFREAHAKYFSKSLPFSLEDCNEIGRKYEYVCLGPKLDP